MDSESDYGWDIFSDQKKKDKTNFPFHELKAEVSNFVN